ncbi:hypothetical protein PGT21_026598 [Puccinia graminis f. sp. tritici]|uniref:Uncharacterized protein n=1 Tax=Puccinia graminis f. sp. tritici TaxID=56615 RepID=A0A5B0MXC4_PUCGR|nr:hypothetical protein PGT21_026598 [Puccinia graminis f. sp. tritici]KAA1131129.1 hypothetical protein PGTUg99_012712 [Puccinia graminis f. sp. tritici]
MPRHKRPARDPLEKCVLRGHTPTRNYGSPKLNEWNEIYDFRTVSFRSVTKVPAPQTLPHSHSYNPVTCKPPAWGRLSSNLFWSATPNGVSNPQNSLLIFLLQPLASGVPMPPQKR